MADEVGNVLGDSKHGINKVDLLRSDGSTAQPLEKLDCAYSYLDLDALMSNLLRMQCFVCGHLDVGETSRWQYDAGCIGFFQIEKNMETFVGKNALNSKRELNAYK